MDFLVDIPKEIYPKITSRRFVIIYESRKILGVNFLNLITKKIKSELDIFVNQMTGLAIHLPYSNTDKLIQALPNIQKLIKYLRTADEQFSKIQYFKDDELKEKLQYTLNLVYKIEALCEKYIYKTVDVEVESEALKIAFSELSKNAAGNTFKK